MEPNITYQEMFGLEPAYLAGIQAFCKQPSPEITLSVIDLGDCDYVVKLYNNGDCTYSRYVRTEYRLIKCLCSIIKQSGTEIFQIVYLDSCDILPINCAISTRDATRNMVRVKSSNLWSIALDVKSNKDSRGNLFIQFKGKNGGPEDIYQYFDVPVNLYRRFVTATSKGAFFWRYIRNNYQYRKLTGNKRGVLPNAIN